MTDLGTEPALDADEGLRATFIEWLAERQRKTPNFSFNIGEPPEKKNDTKTSGKKRIHVPKKSMTVQDLEKRLKIQKLSDKVTDGLAKIEKIKEEMKNTFETMKRENFEIDKMKEVELQTLSTKIDEIKSNIDKINEEATKKKDLLDDGIKQWQLKEKKATNEAQRSIDDKQKMLDETKEKAKQIIEAEKQREKDETDKINIEIQNIEDATDTELTNITNNIKAKQNELAKKQKQFNKYIKRKKEEAAVEKARIDKEIRDIKENEKTEKRKIKKETKKRSETLKKAIDESNKSSRKLKEEIKYLEEKKALKENEIKELVNRRLELEENIRFIQHVHTYEAENVSRIQKLQKRHTREEFNRNQQAQSRTSYVPRPSTSRDYIKTIELSDEETHTAHQHNCGDQWPPFWQRSRSDRV